MHAAIFMKLGKKIVWAILESRSLEKAIPVMLWICVGLMKNSLAGDEEVPLWDLTTRPFSGR